MIITEEKLNKDLDKIQNELQMRSLSQIVTDLIDTMYHQFNSNVKSIQNNKKIVDYTDYLSLLGTDCFHIQDLTANQIAKIYDRTFDLIMPLPDVAEKYNFLTNEFIDLMAGNDDYSLQKKLDKMGIEKRDKLLTRINERNCLETLIKVNSMKNLSNCWEGLCIEN